MSSKAETTFYTGVHKHLPTQVHREKMSNPYRGGTPDCYYELWQSLWVEYKFAEIPKRASTLITPDLSALQYDWLKRNYDHGHKPWVIVGSPVGGIIIETPAVWHRGIPAEEFCDRAITKKEIAQRILQRVAP